MKKRYLEFVLVLVVMAGLAVFLSPDKPESEPRHFEHVIVQGSPKASETPQNSPAYELWVARYQEGLDALGQGDNQKAEASFQQALDLARQLGEPTYLSHDALAHCYYRQGDYVRSAEHQREAIRGAAELQKHEVVGLYESRLALSLLGLSEAGQAHDALQRARKAYQQAYPQGSPAYSEAMNSLAQQYRNMGENGTAEELLEEHEN